MSDDGARLERINAPFTDEQVAGLRRYQRSGPFHSFTCPNRGDGRHLADKGLDLGTLIPTGEGFHCNYCDYRQTWAHAFMARPESWPTLEGGD